MKNQRLFQPEIVASIAAIALFTALIIVSSIGRHKQRLIDDAKADGRWEQFEACIEAYPSDATCDSCWKAIIEQRK